MSVLNPVTAHIKLVQRDDIFRKIVANTGENAKLSSDSILRGQQVSNLNIQFVSPILAYKVDFSVRNSPD